MKKIAIITTRQNFAWLSMREVFPTIEECWSQTQTVSKIINADIDPLRNYIQYLLSCDVIVLIAFNETISRLVIRLRNTLNFQIPIVLHLYGYATIGCWPLKRFGMLDYLTKGDIFIGTCQGDIKCMNLSLKNALTVNIPYPYIPYEFEKNLVKKNKAFVYIGRISDQKNVDIIIRAYKILLDLEIKHAIPKLIIYGAEDFLGWPNLGIKATNCLENLIKIVEELEISNFVEFMGFTDREEIYNNIGINHIFVSASTHSDENFGMAAMRSLAVGATAVLTNWGGHKIFKEKHPNRVAMIDVEFDNLKPIISPQNFAIGMQEMLILEPKEENIGISNYFSSTSVITSFDKILNDIKYENEKLEVTDLASKIYKQQIYYESLGSKQQAFSGHGDPLVIKFLKAYKDE